MEMSRTEELSKNETIISLIVQYQLFGAFFSLIVEYLYFTEPHLFQNQSPIPSFLSLPF